MASLLEDNARQFGVGSSVEEYNEEIYAPVKLSNSTRRFSSAREMVEYDMEANSTETRLRQQQQARRMEIDRMEDEAYNRQIEQRAKAAAWNDKVMTQRDASRVMESLVDLNPSDPEFLSQKDRLIGQYPMALLDDRVKGVVDAKSKIFEIARQEREKAAEIQTARDNALFSAQAQQQEALKADAIRRERDASFAADDEISKMPPEGRKAYKDAIEKGVSRLDALALARDEDRKVITKSEYRDAQKSAVDLDRSINNLTKQLSEKPDTIGMGDPEYMRTFNENKESIREQLDRAIGRRDAIVEDIMRPYEERIAGEQPKPKDGPKPSTAKPGSPMSVKSLLPTK